MNYRKKVEHFFNELLDTIYPVRVGDVDQSFGDLPKVKDIFLELVLCKKFKSF